MEDQVAQAASAMVSPTTDAPTRRQASCFLEEWTKTQDAWTVYTLWLHSYRVAKTPRPANQVAMQLLCCTMLQTKLRSELPRQQVNTWHPCVTEVRQELWEYLKQPDIEASLVAPCCICNAIIIVRGGFLQDFVSFISNQSDMTPEIGLRLLGCIPMEMEACQDLSGPQVTEQLGPFVEHVLDNIRRRLGDHTTILPACHALKEWAAISHITISQMNTPTLGGPHALLPVLVSVLSSEICQHEGTLQMVAKAITAAIMVVSDQCTPEREMAASILWNAVSHGFIVAPLRYATQNEWHGACHALATLICTLVNEQIDDLIDKSSDAGIQLLLDIQIHPHTPVALIPLECWLTIQEVPVNSRHEDWKGGLLRKVAERLMTRLAYPTSFTNWFDELELEESEFWEMRRLSADVLVSCYFLLRVELVQLFAERIRNATDWAASEAALTCLNAISRDVCARCKARGGNSVIKDRDVTCQTLLKLLEDLVNSDCGRQHILMLETILAFCGSYCPAWNSMNCPPQVILQLLSYLHSNFAYLPTQTAKAVRAVYVSCLSKSISSLDDTHANGGNGTPSLMPMVLSSLGDSVKAVLSTSEVEAMTTVAEGATRLVTKLRDPNMARYALINDLVWPFIHRGEEAIQRFPQDTSQEQWQSPKVQEEVSALHRCLGGIQVVVRFCDAPYIPAMGEWLIEEVGPFLETVEKKIVSTPIHDFILSKWIAVHQQLLRNMLPQKSRMIAIFTNTIPKIVKVLEHNYDSSALKYISAAVESFGGHSVEMDQSFQDLLSHVTNVVTSHGNLSEATELLQAYFECLQRYILFCPTALCYNPQFPTILTMAVQSTTALKSAKESTRASLIFLSNVFGWSSLRLTPQTRNVLADAWNRVLRDLLVQNGLTLCRACIHGLAGGAQMLWPAYCECLVTIIQAALDPQNDVLVQGEVQDTNLSESTVHNWFYASMSSAVPASSRVTPEMCNQVISMLFRLVRQGQKSRSKAKMLLSDFTKIIGGNMPLNQLEGYALS